MYSMYSYVFMSTITVFRQRYIVQTNYVFSLNEKHKGDFLVEFMFKTSPLNFQNDP